MKSMFDLVFILCFIFLTASIVLVKLKLFYTLPGIIFFYFLLMTSLYVIALGYATFLSVYLFVTFAFPSLIIAYLYRARGRAAIYSKQLIEKRLTRVSSVLLVSIATGILSNIYLIFFANKAVGYQLTAMEFSQLFAESRYSYGEGIPVIVRALNVVTHAGAMITTIFFMDRLLMKKKKVYLYILPSALLVIQSLLTGTKSITILILVYILSSILIIINYYQLKKIPLKFFSTIFTSFFLLFFISVLVHFFRTHGNMTFVKILHKILSSYFVIPFFALTDWVQQNDILFPQTPGYNVFEGISYYLTHESKTGVFYYIFIFGELYQTNVYTAYRSIIEDFGLIVSPIIFNMIIFSSSIFQKK